MNASKIPVILFVVLLAVSCTKPGGKSTSGTVYIFRENPSGYPELYEKYSEFDVAEFIKDNPPLRSFADTVYVEEFFVMEAHDDLLVEGGDSTMLAFLAFVPEMETPTVVTDSILGEIIQIRERDGQLAVVERKLYTIEDLMQETTTEPQGEDTEYSDQAYEPVYWIDFFPEGGGYIDPMETYYASVTALDVFDLIYYDKYIPEEFTDTASLAKITVTEASLVSVPGMGEKNYEDSLIIVFMTYVPVPDQGWLEEYEYENEYEHQTFYELYLLQLSGEELHELIVWDMGELYESLTGSYSSTETYDLELFQVSESASLLGIYHDYEDGSEYEGETMSDLTLYAIYGEELHPVLFLELGSSSYEADYQGPPEEQYYHSDICEGELYTTDEIYNGFYTLEFYQTCKEIENGSTIHESTETTYFVWTGSDYSPQGSENYEP